MCNGITLVTTKALIHTAYSEFQKSLIDRLQTFHRAGKANEITETVDDAFEKRMPGSGNPRSMLLRAR